MVPEEAAVEEADGALTEGAAEAVVVTGGMAAAADGSGEVEGQGGEGRGVKSRKAKRKRLSAPS